MKSVVTDKGTRTIRKFVDVDVCSYLAAVEHGTCGDAIYDNVFVLLYELKSLQGFKCSVTENSGDPERAGKLVSS